MELYRKHSALIMLGLVIAIGSYSLGFRKGENSFAIAAPDILNQGEGQPAAVDFSAFWKTWNLINEKYVPASTTLERVDDQEKVYGAIEGLASSLGDPYTVFFPPVKSEMFASEVRGNFSGVGMEVLAQEGSITVVAPLKDSPAARAGIQAADKVIQIDDRTTSGLSTEEAVGLIRGEKGTKVRLTIFRAGTKEPFELSIIRDTINLPVIATKIIGGDVFKIDLYSFSENSPNLFRGALREFITSGADKLILDLRGNPGGYLEASIDMASWFLPSSKVIVSEDFGGRQESRNYRSRGYDIFKDDLKFVILVDKGSASASEILAGALSEHGRAILVGGTTFGKGSVQELIDITPETSLKVTVARWLTPKGNSISETGIVPEYVVELTAEDRAAGRDRQVEKALEILRK